MARYEDNERRGTSYSGRELPERERMGGSRYQDNRYRDSQRKDRRCQEERRSAGRRGRTPKKKKGSALGNILTTVLLIAALAVFGYSAFTLYGYYREYKAGTDEYGALNDRYVTIVPSEEPASTEASGEAQILTSVEELEDPEKLSSRLETARKEEAVENGQTQTLPTLKNPIHFDELNAVNEDIIGWIRIGALDLSYPVAQSEDNDYYLHRTFERTENFAGCIFLNCDNTRYFTDQNTIIYGHNMKNGSMFGTLKKFSEQETYDKNPYFWIFAPEFIYQYRIFSCSEVNKIGDPYRIRFLTEDFQNFINTSQSTSMLDNHGVEVTTQDRIVTLSTCTSDDSTRLIVQGKLEQVYIAK